MYFLMKNDLHRFIVRPSEISSIVRYESENNALEITKQNDLKRWQARFFMSTLGLLSDPIWHQEDNIWEWVSEWEKRWLIEVLNI